MKHKVRNEALGSRITKNASTNSANKERIVFKCWSDHVMKISSCKQGVGTVKHIPSSKHFPTVSLKAGTKLSAKEDIEL